ncbi:unnamed protein product [Parnassius apollo]|uniref:(apollo) hypothetical protein n=1 Tax=Parnassius apollo TaxID=110799 RepID=A0A8S3X760_PARAO|nr:unnamed protein product [Parnassius apollo]
MCAVQGWCSALLTEVQYIITLRDREGEHFNALSHVIDCRGFPHWNETNPNSNMWERGPLACATDQCNTNLHLEGFLSIIVNEEREVMSKLARSSLHNRCLILIPEALGVSGVRELEEHITENAPLGIFLTVAKKEEIQELDSDNISILGSVIPPLSVKDAPHSSA